MELKRASSEKLWFLKIRARSRSFIKMTQLIEISGSDSDDDDLKDFYGYSNKGNMLTYSPSDPLINSKYIQVQEIFAETLSPTIVNVVNVIDSTQVNLQIITFYTNFLSFHQSFLYLIAIKIASLLP